MSYEVIDAVAWIRFDRPQKKNAFTLEMIDDCARLLERATTADEVRVLVLSGTGGSFCAGVDLDDLEANSGTPVALERALQERVHVVARRIAECPKPVIAAVRGPAFGAGMDMAMMCDVLLAGSSAVFAESYIHAGLVPGDGGCWLLPRIVGRARALEMLWSGRRVDASEAQELGIALCVVEDDELEHQAAEYAAELAQRPPLAVRAIKRLTNLSAETSFAAALQTAAAATAVVRSSQDSAEALDALRTRRAPAFTGR